jgi:preprotein translocase subunit YajC
MEQMLLPILMFAGLGGLMYFSMKKQKRVAAATKQMHESLVPGARVMTTSGLHGTVTAIADDTIELEIAPGLRTTWVRAAVREIVVPGPTEDSDYETVDSADYDAIDERVVDADEVPPKSQGINIRKSDLN